VTSHQRALLVELIGDPIKPGRMSLKKRLAIRAALRERDELLAAWVEMLDVLDGRKGTPVTLIENISRAGEMGRAAVAEATGEGKL